MNNKEESRTDLGVIRIHKNVIASIAAASACEVEGVKQIGTNFKSEFLSLAFGKKLPLAIKVEFDKNGEVKLDVPVIIKFGFNIPDTAAKVQENIRSALEKMTNLSVKDINIVIQGIDRDLTKGGR